MNLKKSAYAVIPATILYNHKLNDGEKLMYGHISNLSNEYGFCWASNGYLATLSGKSISTVKRILKRLDDFGYLNISHIAKNDQDERRITLNHYPKNTEDKSHIEGNGGGSSKMSHPQLKNEPGGGSKMSHIINQDEYANAINLITPPIPPQKEAASPVPAKAGEKRKQLSSTFSQEVKDLADAVIAAIVAVKPDFAIPVNKIPLMTSLDLMIRHDKRSPQKIIDVLRWALADPFWNDKMLKSNVAEYLRKDNRLDSLDAKMNAKPSNSGFNKVDRRCKNRDGTPIDTPHLDNLF